MAHGDDRDNITTAVNEWDSSIEFGPTSNTRSLVKALLSQANRIDDTLDAIYHSHNINSATGDELKKFGRLANTQRKSGEGDDKYRARIKAELAQARTGTDFDSFVQFTSSVLNTDSENLVFSTNYEINSATVTVGASPPVFDDAPLTTQEVVDVIGGGVPAGHTVKVQERGTFRLKTDGEVSDADKGLTSDTITTGGTLAQDLV